MSIKRSCVCVGLPFLFGRKRETRKTEGNEEEEEGKGEGERESGGRMEHRVQRDHSIAHEIEREPEKQTTQKIAHETYKNDCHS